MGKVLCEICRQGMHRNGTTSSGRQRWRCRACGVSRLVSVDTQAKRVESFLGWLFSKSSLEEYASCSGRTLRRRYQDLWELWPLPDVVDESYEVVFVDGLHLGRDAVVLVASTFGQEVLGWYVARQENSRAWIALLEKIAAPRMVVCDGGSGFGKALSYAWPDSRVQRCLFHVWNQIRSATSLRPQTRCGVELLSLGKRLLLVGTVSQAEKWVQDYLDWTRTWKYFLSQKTMHPSGSKSFTHYRLVRARNSINRLIRQGTLFTFLDPTWPGLMPGLNNHAESINSQLRNLLRCHRGLTLEKRIKTIFWWCYTHQKHAIPLSQAIKTMPTNQTIEQAYQQINPEQRASSSIKKWGDTIVWAELHHTTYPYNH